MIRDQAEWISIHALREEGDTGEVDVDPEGDISIHALREEGDTVTAPDRTEQDKFLSTPSARRATTTTPMVFAPL